MEFITVDFDVKDVNKKRTSLRNSKKSAGANEKVSENRINKERADRKTTAPQNQSPSRGTSAASKSKARPKSSYEAPRPTPKAVTIVEKAKEFEDPAPSALSARILPQKNVIENHISTRTRTYGKVIVDPYAKWVMSVTPPDRDELIYHQDIEIDRFYKKGWRDKQIPPSPQSPKERTHTSGSTSRHRPSNQTSGTVLKSQSELSNPYGIHSEKWQLNGGLNEESITTDWVRPTIKEKSTIKILESAKPRKPRPDTVHVERSISSLLLDTN